MKTVLFSVNPGDGLPIYRQIVDQMKAAIASGRLQPGDRLPTHRDLARDLAIAPLTVKKAYDMLRGERLIEMSQGQGSFVAAGPRAAAPEARADLEARASGLVRQGRLLGLDARELKALIERHWEKGRE